MFSQVAAHSNGLNRKSPKLSDPECVQGPRFVHLKREQPDVTLDMYMLLETPCGRPFWVWTCRRDLEIKIDYLFCAASECCFLGRVSSLRLPSQQGNAQAVLSSPNRFVKL